MATGALSIFAWNRWIAPDIDDILPSMVVNGLAMMATHYLVDPEIFYIIWLSVINMLYLY
ncbi:hypothetical protein [Cardinium endosymbiont of Tipula unca]|uniref:hypothetical protein n=1 Tax=Cardinium endosymbiont of Tipula unca TaxID=3066216 RepID=UPI0030D60FAF